MRSKNRKSFAIKCFSICFLTVSFQDLSLAANPLKRLEASPDFSDSVPVSLQSPSEASVKTTPKATSPIRFALNFSQAFVTQCASCKPRYVR